MPELQKLLCNVCQDGILLSDEERDRGTCDDCHSTIEFARKDDAEPDDEADPEVLKAVEDLKARRAYMKEYNSRPEVQAYRKQYMKDRAARQKLLLKKAKDAGLI